MSHATPDQRTLENLLADLLAPSPGYRYSDFAASTDARIVVDPATPLPYVREEHVYWYVSLGRKPAEKLLQSEHVMSTTRYAATVAGSAVAP